MSKCNCCENCEIEIAGNLKEIEKLVLKLTENMKLQLKVSFLEVLKDMETEGVAFFVDKTKAEDKSKN